MIVFNLAAILELLISLKTFFKLIILFFQLEKICFLYCESQFAIYNFTRECFDFVPSICHASRQQSLTKTYFPF